MEKFYVKKVIFIIIAFAIVALGIDALIQGNGQSVRYVEENLVMVEDNQYHEENDGKIVAIKGKLTTNENVEDNLFGVSVANSPIMERIVLEYRYYNKAAQNYDENRLYGRWEDKTTVAEYIDNDLYQVEQFVDELTEDKSVQDINKQVFQTNAFLNGTFEIPSDKLLQFTVNKPVILDTTKSSVNVAN